PSAADAPGRGGNDAARRECGDDADARERPRRAEQNRHDLHEHPQDRRYRRPPQNEKKPPPPPPKETPPGRETRAPPPPKRKACSALSATQAIRTAPGRAARAARR